jgi:23S rRNA (pseudouridine1915-N3)-methyltransferase
VKLKVAWVGKTKEAAIQSLTSEYVKRIARYVSCEHIEAASESALLSTLKKASRVAPVLLALDSRGKQLSSEELAKYINQHQERGTQELVFAIGPPDGWTDETRSQADLLLSLGKMTLPHELARVVMLEQIYRAFTILKNHPYHTGH